MSGPKIAANSSSSTSTSPTIASLFRRNLPNASRQTPSLLRAVCARPGAARTWVAIGMPLAVPDPWVDVAVQHIDDDVQQRHRRRVDDRNGHDHGVVAVADRDDEVAPDARDAEEVLDDE